MDGLSIEFICGIQTAGTLHSHIGESVTETVVVLVSAGTSPKRIQDTKNCIVKTLSCQCAVSSSSHTRTGSSLARTTSSSEYSITTPTKRSLPSRLIRTTFDVLL